MFKTELLTLPSFMRIIHYTLHLNIFEWAFGGPYLNNQVINLYQLLLS